MSSRTLSRRADHRQPNPITASRSVLAAMYVGLGMTVVVMIIPFIDHATFNALADHIKAGYPTYTQADIDTAANIYLVYLSVVGVLGVAGWLWTARAVKTGKRWARGATTAMFTLGATLALTDLLIKDTSGDTGLPQILGWVGVLPCLPGLLTVILLWRRPRPGRETER